MSRIENMDPEFFFEPENNLNWNPEGSTKHLNLYHF